MYLKIRPEPSKKPYGPNNQQPKVNVISVKDVVKDAKVYLITFKQI